MLRKYFATLFSLLLFVAITAACQAQSPPASALTSPVNFTETGMNGTFTFAITGTGTVASTVVSNNFPSSGTYDYANDGFDWLLGIYGGTGTHETSPCAWEVIPKYIFTVKVTPPSGYTVTSMSPSITCAINVDFYQWEEASAGGWSGDPGEWTLSATDDDDDSGDPSLNFADSTYVTPAAVQSVDSTYLPFPPNGSWANHADIFYPSSTSWSKISSSDLVVPAAPSVITCTAVPGNNDWEGTSPYFYIPATSVSGKLGAAIPVTGESNTTGSDPGGGSCYASNAVAAYPGSLNSYNLNGL